MDEHAIAAIEVHGIIPPDAGKLTVKKGPTWGVGPFASRAVYFGCAGLSLLGAPPCCWF